MDGRAYTSYITTVRILMTLVEKIKEVLKEYQEENGTLDNKEYEKMFVNLYLQYQDEYLKQKVRPIRSDGKIRKTWSSN
jgi:hypothetical protein